MSDIIETKEQRILALDSQILDGIQKCPFYTFLNFIKNYRPNETIVPMERGDLGHTMLEMYYKLLKKGYGWDEAVRQSALAGREHYQSLKLDLQTSEWIVKTFYDYVEYYKYDGLEIIGVEESFSFILYESPELIVIYQGKIDLHCGIPNVGPLPMDHKWRAMKADYIALDNQLIGYAIFTKSPLVYINEVGLQKSYGPEKKFRRIPLMVSDGIKERWIKNTIVWAKILDFNIQNNIWPQSHLKVPPTGITQCAKCTYSKICSSENDEEMLRKIQIDFHIDKPWDVGNKLEEVFEAGE